MQTLQNGIVTKVLWIIVLIAVMVLSLTVGNDRFSSPEFHADTIRGLEKQKNDALMLSVSVTAASTLVSMLPDDTATPIAEELAQLTLPLFLIVSMIYLEIFMVTTFGWIASVFLIPAACILAIGYIILCKDILRVWGKRALILALTLLLLIPASAKVTSKIEGVYQETLNQKLQAAAYIAKESENKEETKDVLSFFSGLADNVTSAVDTAKNMLGTMVDAIAILVITSLVIPVLTALAFVWIAKNLMDADISVDKLYAGMLAMNRSIQEQGKKRRMRRKAQNF